MNNQKGIKTLVLIINNENIHQKIINKSFCVSSN